MTTIDEGATARGEAMWRVAAGASTIAPYLFAAGGYGRIARPTRVEAASLTAGAFGAGARLSLAAGRATLGVEYAYGLASVAALDRRGRVNIAAGVRF